MLLALLVALDVHPALSAGVGGSHDFAGARLELRLEHLSLSAAAGPLNLGWGAGGEPQHSAAFGARWLFGEGAGPFLAASWFFLAQRFGVPRDRENPVFWEHTNVLSLVGGYRVKWTNFFLDAGAGAYLDTDSSYKPTPFFDLTLAIGFEL
jgi:hypothetical protein